MIEFKAECGHTVRARDEDAGSVVRCAYCGRNADVPTGDTGELDFLFRDVKQPEETKKRRRRRRKPKVVSASASKPPTFDPFTVVIKVCYVAAVLVISIFIARWWVLPKFAEDAATPSHETVPAEQTVDAQPEPPLPMTPRVVTPGLIGRAAKLGLYVASTPAGAKVYVAERAKAPASGRINEVPGTRQFMANGPGPSLPDGDYVVEVEFAWNSEVLTDSGLPTADNYRAFRRQIEDESPDQHRSRMKAFFIPDSASDVFVDNTADQIYLVRQYREISVRQGRSAGVRALFLPRISLSEGESFSIEPLLTAYLPGERLYAFNEQHVRSELAYYEVDQRSVQFILDALSRIGAIPFVAPDGRTRVFKIDIHDGGFKANVIGNIGE